MKSESYVLTFEKYKSNEAVVENKISFQIASETITQLVEKVTEIDQILNSFFSGFNARRPAKPT